MADFMIHEDRVRSHRKCSFVDAQSDAGPVCLAGSKGFRTSPQPGKEVPPCQPEKAGARQSAGAASARSEQLDLRPTSAGVLVAFC